MKYKIHTCLFLVMLAAILSLGGCTANDGAPGADGKDGADGAPGADGKDGAPYVAGIDLSNLEPESCVICHSDDGSIALSGAGHQAEYDKYNDASAFTLTINSVVSTGTNPYDSTMTFTITKDGAPYDDAGLSNLDQKRYYASLYDSGTNKFNVAFSYGSPTLVGAGTGQYTVTATGKNFAPEASDAQVYAYIADGKLETEGMTLYTDVANAGMAFNAASTFDSAANVEACEACHGTPYMKHGYRAAEVAGLSTFGGCKSCHVDTTDGTHPDWQLLADDPARYAELDAIAKACLAEIPRNTSCDSIRENMTLAEYDPGNDAGKYFYKRSLMNDVHMAHNMEFPYPQSMSNCATCHEGKLTTVLDDTQFSAETCSSCHAVDGLVAKMLGTPAGALLHSVTIINDLEGTNCSGCHSAGGGVGAPVLADIHSGYDKVIYADAATYTVPAGTKYAEAFTVDVDNATSFDSGTNILTIHFSATQVTAMTGLAVTDIVPTVMVGPYGYDTKHYIVYPHGRDAERNRLLEYTPGTVHPRFTTVTAAGGIWEVTADMTMWADKIADGTIKRVEIGVMPELYVAVGAVDDDTNMEEDDIGVVAMNAPSRTFDLGANAFDDTYFPDVVDVAGGCNTCHDALATTFHNGKRGGNIKICKMCHVPSARGSHMEMQSRSIDSYVHAIHSFQAFDIGDVDFSDPVEALEYEHHINHTFPNFTIKNCESCHTAGTYGVPDQSKSLPSVSSASDTVADRNIGTVPQVVTGPASRACGSCHRASMINADDAGKLAAFDAHAATFGYRVEDDDGVWDAIVEKIMSLF